MNYIKNLSIGDTFILSGLSTVYECSRPVRTEGGLTAVTYRVAGGAFLGEYRFVRTSLSTYRSI